MASTYTANSGIQLPANGEQSGTWGETINDNMDIIDRLTNGVGAISLSGTTHTLTITDGTLSEGQYNVLVLGGSPSGTNTITITPNDGQHVYIVKNSSGQSAIFTQGSGGDITLLNGQTKVIYSDGVGAGSAVVDITNDFAMGNVTITGGAISGATLSTSSFTLGGVAITATGTEINILDGVTATAAEINILDGVTATAAEINILDGVTATAAELNYNDITTLGTVEASKTVTADASGDVLFPDGDKAIFGAGSDLQIYHDGSNSLISDQGTGSLVIRATDFAMTNAGGSQNMMLAVDGGAVTLHHNGSAKIATTATGVDITGTAVTDGLTVDGTLDIEEVYELVTTQTSTTGTITFDTTAQGVEFYTVDQTANRTINFSNVNANLAIGQSVTGAILLTQGATAYYLNAYQIDTVGVTPKWQGGSAPAAGNINSIDSYSFTIIKTADATFTVLASQTQFA
jgi:hypothetical protein